MGVEITGMDALKARLAGIAAQKTLALKAAGIAVLTIAQKKITNGGNGWPPWKKSYKPKRTHQMLWDLGTLVRSLAVGGSENEFEINGDTITVGTNVKYAQIQQYGGRGILPRPYLTVDDATKTAAMNAYMAVFQRSLK